MSEPRPEVIADPGRLSEDEPCEFCGHEFGHYPWCKRAVKVPLPTAETVGDEGYQCPDSSGSHNPAWNGTWGCCKCGAALYLGVWFERHNDGGDGA